MFKKLKNAIKEFYSADAEDNCYETVREARDLFKYFIEWYQERDLILTRTPVTPDELLDEYLKEKDIAIVEIRIYKGAYTRNPRLEVTLALGATAVGSLIATGLAYLFIW